MRNDEINIKDIGEEPSDAFIDSANDWHDILSLIRITVEV